MFSKRQTRIFYLLTTALCLVAWLWLALDSSGLLAQERSICLFKNITGLPCPGCGTTRSVKALLHGHWGWSEIANPQAYPALLALMLLPLWLAADMIRGRNSLQVCAIQIDRNIRTQPVWAVLIFGLIIANWIWNIHKQL